MDFIVSRAPFRVSFAGGGTDLPSFYHTDKGFVLSTTINRYVYVMVNRRNPLFGQGIDDSLQYRIRLSYSSTENTHRSHQCTSKRPSFRYILLFRSELFIFFHITVYIY